MKAIVKAIFSFMLTSWTYSEIMLVFPEIEPFTKQVISTLTIPTHDEWRVYYDKEYQAKVKEEINGFLVSNGLDTQTYQSSDFEEFLKIPKNIETHSKETNYISIFENSVLPETLYESF